MGSGGFGRDNFVLVLFEEGSESLAWGSWLWQIDVLIFQVSCALLHL